MEAYPLHWPFGYKRTHTIGRVRSQFKQTMDKAQKFLRDELRRLNAHSIIVSTNIPIRKDGGMYTEYMNRKLEDPGVAVYFKYKNKDVCLCCDRYLTVWENTYALGKAIESIRGMARWGVSDFIDRAFTGFLAIEGPKIMDKLMQGIVREWYDLLECRADSSEEVIKANYRRLCRDWHPDTHLQTGAHELAQKKIREINEAYETAKKVRGFK